MITEFEDIAGAMQHPPEYLIVENVVGFEGSAMRAQLAAGLNSANLDMQASLNCSDWCSVQQEIVIPASCILHISGRKRPATA